MSKRLKDNLKKRATAWAGQLTKLAKGFAPNHLKPYISSHVEAKEDGTYRIRITANRGANPTGPGHPNYGSSDARAQEFGSGLRARRGPKQKYLIHPKNAKFLEFEGTNQFEGWIIRTMEVKHPGIKAANQGKGYLAPAMNEIRKRARAELTKEIRDAIVGDLRESFGRKA